MFEVEIPPVNISLKGQMASVWEGTGSEAACPAWSVYALHPGPREQTMELFLFWWKLTLFLATVSVLIQNNRKIKIPRLPAFITSYIT